MDKDWSQCLQTLEIDDEDEYEIFSVAWSPDGSQLASLSLFNVKIWYSDTSECRMTLEDSNLTCSSVWWLSDTEVASMSNCEIMVWNLDTGQCVKIVKDNLRGLSSMAWSRGRGRLAFASKESIQVLDRDTNTFNPGPVLEGHTSNVLSMKWSPDESKLALISNKKSVMVWNLQIMECIDVIRDCDTWIDSISWSPDGFRLALGSHDNTIKIWDLRTRKCVSLKGHTNWVNQIAWSPDGS